MNNNIERKLNKYRQKLINSTDPYKTEIYNLKMQQYIILQKSGQQTASVSGSETSALNFSNIQKEKIIESYEPMKNFLVSYYSEELNKLTKGDIKKLKNIREELKLLEKVTLEEIKQNVKNPIVPTNMFDLDSIVEESTDEIPTDTRNDISERVEKPQEGGFRRKYVYRRN